MWEIKDSEWSTAHINFLKHWGEIVMLEGKKQYICPAHLKLPKSCFHIRGGSSWQKLSYPPLIQACISGG